MLTSEKNPKIICHRGNHAGAKYLQNTYASVRLAKLAGFHGVELDVRRAKEGELCLAHGEDKSGDTLEGLLYQFFEEFVVPHPHAQFKFCFHLKNDSKMEAKELREVVRKYPWLDYVVFGISSKQTEMLGMFDREHLAMELECGYDNKGDIKDAGNTAYSALWVADSCGGFLDHIYTDHPGLQKEIYYLSDKPVDRESLPMIDCICTDSPEFYRKWINGIPKGGIL